MNKKAFTILELLVVISVLAILIGIAIPRIKGMQQAGQITQVKAELQTLQSATESYFSTNQSYPAGSSGATAMTTLVAATPQILSTQLNDPFNSSSAYGYYSTGNYYVWYSQGVASSSITDTVSTTGVVTSASGGYCSSIGTGC